jgi:microcompartment protein CcmL/EutN
MNVETIGAIELLSIAFGYHVLDVIVKAAPVTILSGEIINPGKYLILISGDVASVEIAMDAGIEAAGEYLHDHMLIKSLDEQVLPAFNAFLPPADLDALGIIESVSVIGAIEAADIAAKEANVSIVSIRSGNEAGGRGILTFSGSIGDTQHAVEAAVEALEERDRLFSRIIIPGPHPDFKGFFSGN